MKDLAEGSNLNGLALGLSLTEFTQGASQNRVVQGERGVRTFGFGLRSDWGRRGRLNTRLDA